MLKLTLRDGEIFEGATPLDLVRAMKGASMFSNVKDVLHYVAVVQDRAKDDEELKTLIARCEGSISAAWVRRDEPGKLRLLKGDMPLDAAYAPKLRAVFYSSEAWMLRSVLNREPHRMLDLDPFTLSTFDASSLPDFTQQDVFFLSPDAMDPLTP